MVHLLFYYLQILSGTFFKVTIIRFLVPTSNRTISLMGAGISHSQDKFLFVENKNFCNFFRQSSNRLLFCHNHHHPYSITREPLELFCADLNEITKFSYSHLHSSTSIGIISYFFLARASSFLLFSVATFEDSKNRKFTSIVEKFVL